MERQVFQVQIKSLELLTTEQVLWLNKFLMVLPLKYEPLVGGDKMLAEQKHQEAVEHCLDLGLAETLTDIKAQLEQMLVKSSILDIT